MNLTEKLGTIRPIWIGQIKLIDVLQRHGYPDRLLLHAGPPFRDKIPIPVRNSLASAVLFEGWASNYSEAFELIDENRIPIYAAQDLNAVVPLAGVISPSMSLHVIKDLDSGAESYAAVNEGMDHLLRVGTIDKLIPHHHKWLNGKFSEWLNKRVTDLNGIDLFKLLAQSLLKGDDGHSRTVVGSYLVKDHLNTSRSDPPEFIQFLEKSTAFALNLWMAACALVERAAIGSNSDLITKVGGNGVDFGFQIAKYPDKWFRIASQPPVGYFNPGPKTSVLPAIGDSAVVDFFGLGGQTLSSAPCTAQGLSGFIDSVPIGRASKIGTYNHPVLGIRSGLSKSSIRDADQSPLILLGMIAENGIDGRVGGGVFSPSLDDFM
ncbi:DUF1116 domain-containing protein [Corynebacterium poyangense]|uniref:DUF1116 domain-containing protein n=1 Tax=Corynebacterium poyangense TaxID=2684405 RepID=A0A7H0SKX5_9CORY|nr:DUF1116 domain-containing protein [Corynebacterium poyangense]QNQ89200.1 DUF1116 domain-containing protein [Corynebacterium poyangense]